MLEKVFKFREGEKNPEAVKPFLDHLEDLRWMLIKLVATASIGMVVAFAFHVPLIQMMQHPLRLVDATSADKLQILSPIDGFIITFEISFYAGLVVTFPILLYFVAQFVIPALTFNERKIIIPAIGSAFALFIVGVLFCYFFILPKTLGFFISYAHEMNWQTMWHVREYFSFVTQITLAFGICFELPIIVLALVYFRVLTCGFLRRTRPFAIVIILLLAAVIAPTPDPVTFLSLGLPMCLLYEGCIWLGWLLERARLKALELPGPPE